MSKTVYISLKENVIVSSKIVKVGDVAEIYCNDVKVAKKITELEILQFNKIPNRTVVFVTEVISVVEDFFKDINIVNLDNTSVIVQYSIQKTNNRLLEICKVTIVCLIVFFGAGFAIMSFNEDVSTSSLFKNVYELFTGKESNGRTLIEASYSIGLGFGIIMLYGHFWKTRITNDPTPTEVEMSKYEKDINSTIISNSNKEENG